MATTTKRRYATKAEVEKAARDLLDALDRMSPTTGLSMRVVEARHNLRLLLPAPPPDPADVPVRPAGRRARKTR